MITTASRAAWPTDVAIVDGASAGLAHPSIVRWKLFTLPNQMILRQIGRLAAADRAAIVDVASRSFARD